MSDIKFDEALKQVEEIISKLQSKDIELEEAIELYEKGVYLLNYCEEKLKTAKTKVQVILKTREGFKLEELEKAMEVLKNGKRV